ncbi:hypothetical protein [Amycolatopsis sp. NPDC059657]|uniref:hypothetical protein n=1 Tax=Amycolatopsis sp. NPDC059657 TaxID=3346899 RepID=UPI003670C544
MILASEDVFDVSDRDPVVNIVTAIAATVVALTFLFGFGNVLNLALRLGVPIWIAPLVAPAVDLSVLGLLLAIRQLALRGAAPGCCVPARRLLLFASVVTLALNVADPLISGHVGKAAFDAVGPLLLIGWAEVGPELLLTLAEHQGPRAAEQTVDGPDARRAVREGAPAAGGGELETDLVARARREDAAHRARYQRPISAEVLRKRLRIGTQPSRKLVALVRSEYDSSYAARAGSGLANGA